jgi:hypothetical protein
MRPNRGGEGVYRVYELPKVVILLYSLPLMSGEEREGNVVQESARERDTL